MNPVPCRPMLPQGDWPLRWVEGTPRPQAMLFTLWGDYVVHRGGEIWVGSLIRIAAEFGLSEPALRAVLNRMARAGWLQATRQGRRSFYCLTPRGQAVIREGAARIFQPRRAAWDGTWHVVAYSIPEPQREQRDHFRKRLTYLGFGQLAAGAWITPHPLAVEVAELARELGVAAYVDQLNSTLLPPEQGPTLAARVWPLAELAGAYHGFIERWQAVQARLTCEGVTDAQAFVLRFWLIHEYQRFFLDDPDLPPALVPPGWPGASAAALFEALHDRLALAANRFFDAVYASRSLAQPARMAGE